MSFFTDIGSYIMTPLYYLVSGVLVVWHSIFGAVFGADSAAAWALSVVGLTVVIRAALIPLFVRQIKASRNMQLIQPKVKELQKKYGHDREKLAAETMALYKESGTNPFASCLPLIIQMPIFFALFRLVDHAAKQNQGHGFLTNTLAQSFANAPFFGGALKNSFTSDGGSISVKIIAAVLVVVMTATTFLTQRQLMSKNMPADAMSGQYAQQQKMLLYVLPLVFAVGGIAFPIGVILYWTTSNIWTMGQQFWVIRNNPAPNTEAFRAKERRDAEKAKKHGTPAPADGVVADAGSANGTPAAEPEPPKPVQRQQPKKQSRSQRNQTPRKKQPPGNQRKQPKPKPKEDPA